MDPPADLPDLMAHIERYARLEDDAKYVERQGIALASGESSGRRNRETKEEHESWVKQGIHVVFKEQI